MQTINFQCYSCGMVLKVGGDKAGKRGKCPKCGTTLTIPFESAVQPPPAAPPPAAPPPLRPPAIPAPVQPQQYAPGAPPLRAEVVEDGPIQAGPLRAEAVYEEEPYDDYAPPRAPASRWWLPRVGLLIVFIGFCVVAGAFALQTVGYLIDSIYLLQMLTGSFVRVGDTGYQLIRIGDIITLLALLAPLVGYVFCILGPNQRGTMPLAITTVALAGLHLILALVFKYVVLQERTAFGPLPGSRFGSWFMLLLVQMLFCAELIVFPFYLGAVAAVQKRQRSAGSPIGSMVMACIFAGATLVTAILGLLTPSRGLLWVILLMRWVGIGVFITFLIMFILLVWRTRAVIR